MTNILNIFTWRSTYNVWKKVVSSGIIVLPEVGCKDIFLFAVCLMPISSILHNKTKLKISPFHAVFWWSVGFHQPMNLSVVTLLVDSWPKCLFFIDAYLPLKWEYHLINSKTHCIFLLGCLVVLYASVLLLHCFDKIQSALVLLLWSLWVMHAIIYVVMCSSANRNMKNISINIFLYSIYN